MANEYVSADEFGRAVKDSSGLDQPRIESLLTTASRRVDQMTGRRFYLDDTVTPRVYDAANWWWCDVDDFATTTGLIVETDPGNDGTFETTFDASDYVAQPENLVVSGLPWTYTALRATFGQVFPPSIYRKSVRVTAKWGWPAVPAAVKEATILIAVGLYKRPDAPFGVAGFDQFGAVRVRDDPTVVELLARYVHPTSGKFLIA